jgi:peptidoglycan/xylan/chitin deacetylase (PgdA/CDA1 family)
LAVCAALAVGLAQCSGSHNAAPPAVGPRPAKAAAQRRGPSPAVAELERLIKLGYPVYCGGPRGNAVAFTFDDGPGPYTHLVLRNLVSAGERVTFFLVGRSMDNWPGYLPRELKIAALGDHTYIHPVLTALPPAQIASQLETTKLKIERQSGARLYLFRPPYGARNATVDRVARRLGLLEILWTVDSADSLGANWRQIIHNVEAGLRPGAIFLMHENHGQTIRALATLLAALHRRHLRSVTVPELLASDPPSLAQLRRGPEGCGRLESEALKAG